MLPRQSGIELLGELRKEKSTPVLFLTARDGIGDRVRGLDETHDSLSNLVDVYISRLRGKLGSHFVTTRRGEGYIVDV